MFGGREIFLALDFNGLLNGTGNLWLRELDSSYREMPFK